VPVLKEILYFGNLPAPEHTHAQQQQEHMHIAQRFSINMVTFILDRPPLLGQQTSVLLVDATFRSKGSEFSNRPGHPSNRPVSVLIWTAYPIQVPAPGIVGKKGARNKLVTPTNRTTSADLVGE
jgi:hypothetical protein